MVITLTLRILSSFHGVQIGTLSNQDDERQRNRERLKRQDLMTKTMPLQERHLLSIRQLIQMAIALSITPIKSRIKTVNRNT